MKTAKIVITTIFLTVVVCAWFLSENPQAIHQKIAYYWAYACGFVSIACFCGWFKKEWRSSAIEYGTQSWLIASYGMGLLMVYGLFN